MTFREIFEAFKDIGKLSDEELRKGQKLKEGEVIRVDGTTFYRAITQIKKNDMARGDEAKGLETLSVYDRNDYKKMQCYLGENNSSGFAIKKGDLVSVFSSRGSSADVLVDSAVKLGAKTLDCFALLENGKLSGALYKLYSRHGFKVNKNLTTGELGVPYTIQNGISRFVNDKEEVELDNPQVVIFMTR